MAKVCDICGKGPVFGHNVSHANNKTRKIWYPNLHKVKTLKEGRTIRMKVCSRCLRSGLITKAAYSFLLRYLSQHRAECLPAASRLRHIFRKLTLHALRFTVL